MADLAYALRAMRAGHTVAHDGYAYRIDGDRLLVSPQMSRGAGGLAWRRCMILNFEAVLSDKWEIISEKTKVFPGNADK